jgi:IMP cyclohydrolase
MMSSRSCSASKIRIKADDLTVVPANAGKMFKNS